MQKPKRTAPERREKENDGDPYIGQKCHARIVLHLQHCVAFGSRHRSLNIPVHNRIFPFIDDSLQLGIWGRWKKCRDGGDVCTMSDKRSSVLSALREYSQSA